MKLSLTRNILTLTFSIWCFLPSILYGQDIFSSQAKHALYHLQKYQQSGAHFRLGSDLAQSDIPKSIQKELGITKHMGRYFVDALIMADNSLNRESLTDIGIIVSAKAGNVWSIRIPVEKLNTVSTLKGIKALDTGTKMKLLTDHVEKESTTNLLGIKNQVPYFYGDSVIVGIIDNGFDYTHPTFFDRNTKKSRISRAWNQIYNADESGLNVAPPTGYDYGMELVNLQNIIASIDTASYLHKQLYLNDGSNYSHGTRVTHIAAGSGLGTNSVNRGVAPAAQIVLVAIDDDWSSANIVDAIQYIFDYASSVNKPAVINLSFGTNIGPHDGTSLLSQAFNNLSGEGRILVGAAGNDGDAKTHLSHVFTKRSTVSTFLGIRDHITLSNEVVDSWASPGTAFSLKVMVNKNTAKIGETAFISSTSNGVFSDTIYHGTDTAFIEIISQRTNFLNRRPNIQVRISTNRGTDELSFALAFNAANTTIHSWCNIGFLDLGLPNYIAGNSSYTIVDGQTAEEIITVGAYVTRNVFTNIYGYDQNFEDEFEIDEIAPFSSQGPTLDKRTKPDITAPGAAIISSISSFDDGYELFYDEEDNPVTSAFTSPINGRVYRYGAESGTSFASPLVTGSVALMLEANPTLTPQHVAAILKTTARRDVFTGYIPWKGNNTWGWGKIDIQAAVREAVRTNAHFQGTVVIRHKLNVYPNPSYGEFTISLKDFSNKQLALKLTDQWGETHIKKKVFVESALQEVSFDVHGLKEGIYVLQVFDGKEHYQTKVFIKK